MHFWAAIHMGRRPKRDLDGMLEDKGLKRSCFSRTFKGDGIGVKIINYGYLDFIQGLGLHSYATICADVREDARRVLKIIADYARGNGTHLGQTGPVLITDKIIEMQKYEKEIPSYPPFTD